MRTAPTLQMTAHFFVAFAFLQVRKAESFTRFDLPRTIRDVMRPRPNATVHCTHGVVRPLVNFRQRCGPNLQVISLVQIFRMVDINSRLTW